MTNMPAVAPQKGEAAASGKGNAVAEACARTADKSASVLDEKIERVSITRSPTLGHDLAG